MYGCLISVMMCVQRVNQRVIDWLLRKEFSERFDDVDEEVEWDDELIGFKDVLDVWIQEFNDAPRRRRDVVVEIL